MCAAVPDPLLPTAAFAVLRGGAAAFSASGLSGLKRQVDDRVLTDHAGAALRQACKTAWADRP